MNSRLQLLALIAVLGTTIAGFGWLYRLRLDQGDSFPTYSSLRSDPLGTRALHDSLAELRGLQVTRRFEPLSELQPDPARTIVIAGMHHNFWTWLPAEDAKAIDRAAKAGSRVILAMREARVSDEAEPTDSDTTKADVKKPEEKEPAKEKSDEDEPAPLVDLKALWHVTIETRQGADDARLAIDAPSDWPVSIRWSSDVYFELADESPWRVLYRRGGKPVLVERRTGRGSIVLAGSSYMMSNEALQLERSPGLLAWLIGPNSTIEFDESHLGVVQQRGVAELARSYGLTGAFVAFVAAALVFIWNRTALFVPPAAEAHEAALHYDQTAGLEALLRRAIARDGVVRACAAEWRKTARPFEATRADAAIEAAPRNTPPVALYNAVVRALRRR